MSIYYKGFEIESTSEQLLQTSKWTTSVKINKHKSSHVIGKEFSAENTFESKEEADNYSIAFGKQIIDGKHNNISLSDIS